MNKRFVISVVVMFVASMLTGFVVHALLLQGDYAKLVPNLFRTPQDSQGHFAYMLLAHVFLAAGFTWMYRAGRDNRPWLGQGIRFGLAVAVLSVIPTYLIYFAVQPMPSDLVAMQIVFDTIAVVILGIVVAAVNRDPVPA
jgi:drug/metabolite transporter (DMT)-like permease